MRKEYIHNIKKAMEIFRNNLEEHSKEQLFMNLKFKKEEEEAIIEKLAGQKHHLLGTKAIPGVFKAKKENESL
ncbi:hypothetical protein HK096_006979, partial [Nowakowskiella sp. JEL0078]